MPDIREGRGVNLRWIGIRLIIAFLLFAVAASFVVYHKKFYRAFDETANPTVKTAYCENLEVTDLEDGKSIKFRIMTVLVPKPDDTYPVIGEVTVLYLFNGNRRYIAGSGSLHRDHPSETFHKVGYVYANHIDIKINYTNEKPDPIVLRTIFDWKVASNSTGHWRSRGMAMETEVICEELL